MSIKRALVTGTTPDYVDIIRKRYPGRAVFLTDERLRQAAAEERPGPEEEITVDLRHTRVAAKAVDSHLARYGIELSGIACYDDESLILASDLANIWNLPFHSPESIRTSRSKFHSKRAWLRSEVSCPRTLTVRDRDGLEGAMDKLGLPLVLKPLTGSGSELVFWCQKREDARKAFRIITRILADHPDDRMYQNLSSPGQGLDPKQDVVVEEGFTGPEFSCDFILSGRRAQLVRLSGKVLAPEIGTGTALIYYVADIEETGIGQRELEIHLRNAARAMGFDRGIFMADFIVHRGRPYFLEVSARPAGDCLPWLVRSSSGIDTLGLALDLAEDRPTSLQPLESHYSLAAFRLFARREGLLRSLANGRLQADPRVLEVVLYRQPGHVVSLPPHDYFSRILGHIVFRPRDRNRLAEEGSGLEALAEVEIAS
jgi:biotin carboxylase